MLLKLPVLHNTEDKMNDCQPLKKQVLCSKKPYQL